MQYMWNNKYDEKGFWISLDQVALELLDTSMQYMWNNKYDEKGFCISLDEVELQI